MKRAPLLILSLLVAGASACGDEETPFVAPAADTGGTDTGASDVAGDASEDTAPDVGVDDVAADVGADATDAGSADVPDDSGMEDAGLEDTGADAAPTMDWDEIFAALDMNGCSGGYCHGGGAGGLSFSDADTAYTALVGTAVQGTEAACGATERIVPGDAEASGFYIRLRPTSQDSTDCGPEKMPPGSSGIDAELADALAAWINAGANR